MICIVHLFLGSDDVPAGFITHNKTLAVHYEEVLPMEGGVTYGRTDLATPQATGRCPSV